jgi:hypothetical protein
MTLTNILTDAPTVTSNGRQLPLSDVTDLRVYLGLNVTSRCELRIRCDDGVAVNSAIPAPVVGDTIEVKADGTTVVFTGEVVSIGLDFDSQFGGEYTVTAFDKTHRLNYGTKIRTFVDQSYSDVLNTIANESGLSPQLDDSLQSPVFHYLLQSTTNFQYLGEIALRTGCQWWCEGGKLIFQPRDTGDPAIALSPELGLRRLRVRYSASEHVTQTEVRSWNSVTKEAIVGTFTTPGPPQDAGAMWPGATSDAVAFGDSVLRTGMLPFTTQDEGNALAKALNARANHAHMIIKGELQRPETGLKIGKNVSLFGVGPASGTHYVTAVEYVFGVDQNMHMKFTAGAIDQSSLVDMLGGGRPAVTPFGLNGVVIGIVTNNKQTAEDSGGCGLGHVKLKFPTLDDSYESAPARLASHDAGNGRGSFFIPEVNDEVLVVFENGDLRRPIVIGSLWNGQDVPPLGAAAAEADGKTVSRQIKTRLGHTLTFNDGTSDDKKNVTVKLADEKTIVAIGHDKIDIIANQGKPIKISNGDASIVFTAQGDLQLTAKNISLTANPGDIKIEGMNVNSKAKTAAKMEGATIEVKSSAMGKVEAGAILELKGSLVKVN